MKTTVLLLLMAAAAVFLSACSGRGKVAKMPRADNSRREHEEASRAAEAGGYEKATFGAGCFWGVEATFRRVEGVVSTAVGYGGGTTANPSYEDVCTDKTGHAEVVEVIYDPAKVRYEKLLE
ncbi:MAG: peptide-methionine (S)-S-oxide reductase, partial [Planctomycetota bacterium]